ncbi:MAG TPA: prepilin peptidase [archaeon]|nr:prepilin peptidase [archaeon]
MIPFVQAYFLITLVALIVATYTDLKERLVSNGLTYGLIAAALLLKGAESYFAANLWPLQESLLAGAIAFAASYALYRIGVWAGGDVKLVTAIAFANPLNYGVLSGIFPLPAWASGTIALPIFSVALILASAFMVFPIGIAMSIGAALKHRKILAQTFDAVRKKALAIAAAAALVAGSRALLHWIFAQYAGAIGSLAYIPGTVEFITLIILIASAFAPKRIAGYAAAALGIIGILLEPTEFIVLGISVAAPLLAVYALWKMYAESREAAFKETIPVEKLEEGMIPDKYIVEKEGAIGFVDAPSIKTVIKQLINNRMEKTLEDFKVEGNVLASPRDAGGISREAVEKLRKMAGTGKSPKSITVRKTMAFVPAILAAYIALQLTGDFVWNILFKIAS